jgi:multidrug resistance efflux pump
MQICAGRAHGIARLGTPLIALATASAILSGCTSAGLQKTTQQAQSVIGAAALTLDQYAEGRSAGLFVRASIDEYVDTLTKTQARLSAIEPREEQRAQYDAAVTATRDALTALHVLPSGITRAAARAAGARLHADLARLSAT